MFPELSQQQLAEIKTAIQADPALLAVVNAGSFGPVVDAFNAPANPTFVVFRKQVATEEVGNAVNYIAVEAMTDANRTRITTFYAMNPVQFAPRSDIRTFWTNTFSGALGGQGQATRDALDALWRRNATRAERLFCTGTGTTVSPGDLGPEGLITLDEVVKAWRG